MFVCFSPNFFFSPKNDLVKILLYSKGSPELIFENAQHFHITNRTCTTYFRELRDNNIFELIPRQKTGYSRTLPHYCRIWLSLTLATGLYKRVYSQGWQYISPASKTQLLRELVKFSLKSMQHVVKYFEKTKCFFSYST